MLDAAGREARDVYQAAWERLTALRADREALGGDARALARELDLARHQAAEISAARLQPGEEEALKASLARLRHVGEITEALGSASASLEDEGGAGDAVRTALSQVDAAGRIDDSLADLASASRRS